MDTILSKDVHTIITRQYENPDHKQVKEKVRQVHRIYYLRKESESRRTMPKFGECKGSERGQHKPGDRLIGGEIKIETLEGAQEQEIDIVKKFAALNTDAIKIKKQEEKLKKLREQDQQAELGDDDFTVVQEPKKKPLREKKTGAQALLDMESFANAQKDVSIALRNLAVFQFAQTDKQQEKIKQEFRDFLEHVIGKSDHSNKYRSRFVSARGTGNPPLLRDIAYVSFTDEYRAEIALDKLDGANFQNCCILAEMAENRR